MPDWSMLQKVFELACDRQVSFSIHFEEGSGTWYGEVTSAAPSEEFVGRSTGFFEDAVGALIKHLEEIGSCNV